MKKAIVVAVIAALAALFVILVIGGRSGNKSKRAATTNTQTTAWKSGAISPSLAIHPRGGTADLDAPAKGTLRLEGQVIAAGPAAKPIAGARVILAGKPQRTATSAKDGSFFFDGLPGGSYRLLAKHGNSVAGPLVVRLSHRNDPVILAMHPGASLAVVVVRTDGGQPIDGATVQLRGVDVRSTKTDASGVGRFEGLPPGVFYVASWADGFATSATMGFIKGRGAVAKSEIRLRPGAMVVGQVVSPAGTPVAGAIVTFADVKQMSRRANPNHDAVVTDAKGRFKMVALEKGNYRFRASHSTFAPGHSDPAVVDGETPRGDVLIKLTEPETVTGTVVDSQGSKVAWAAVHVTPAFIDHKVARDRLITTDEQGRFSVPALAKGRVVFRASHVRGNGTSITVDLANSKTSRELTLRLVHDGQITGIVTDDSGEPVAGAQVIARPLGAQNHSVGRSALRQIKRELSDAGGRFSFVGLRNSKYALIVFAPGGSAFSRTGRPPQATTAKPGDTNVRLKVTTSVVN